MAHVTLPRTLLPIGPDDSDWRDVLRRAAHARRRRHAATIAGGMAAVIIVGVASAYVLGHPIIDFSKAPKGTKKIVNDFGSLEVGAPAGMAPGVLPHQARRITAVRIDGKWHVLWVAPTKQGGFCQQWSQLFGGCRANRHDPFAKHIDVSTVGTAVVGGSFFESDGDRLEVSYADGTSAGIPFVWVSAPIEAGFYLYRIPNEHRLRATRPTVITLFDRDGKVLAREALSDYFAGPPRSALHHLRGYPTLTIPGNAEWAKREQLFALRADDGIRIGLWVAPERAGGMCYWTNQSAGCTRYRGRISPPSPPLALGFEGGATHVNLCCRVGSQVARVEARFGDGARVQLIPKRGYLIWPIPSRYYSLGHRLAELVAFDSSGRVLARRRERVNPGLYPCAKPKNLGYGVSACP
jgi:hypothetical protein